MKHILLAIMAFMAVASASAQPNRDRDWSRDRYRLDPEVRAALWDYCRIKQRQHARNSAVAIPAVCYRYRLLSYPPRRP